MKLANPPRFRILDKKTAALGCALHLCCALPVMADDAPQPNSKEQQNTLTPAAALEKLETGNARFAADGLLHRDWRQQRAQTASAQFPFAVVLGCIDSRVPAEIVFDQGLGDIFNARVAGNIIDDEILGSMEFACKIAGAKLIAVIGHTRCGAVKGACSGARLGHLTGLLEKIRPSVETAKARMPGASAIDSKFVDEVAELNVQNTIRQIREQSPVLRELIDAGSVGIVGGIYDLDSGKVHFFKNSQNAH
jgi:carbonic anhydrase